jgi:hypothetical protein
MDFNMVGVDKVGLNTDAFRWALFFWASIGTQRNNHNNTADTLSVGERMGHTSKLIIWENQIHTSISNK